MSETPILGATDSHDTPPPESSRSKDGRYIPYSGGSLGWYENSGVAKAELASGYRLTTALDPAMVRQRQFERWGEIGNRRGEERQAINAEIAVTVSANGQAWRANVVDVSSHGIRLRSLDALAVKVHERVRLVIEDGGKRLDFEAEVMWQHEAGKLRPVFNLGLAFPGLSAEDSKRLQDRVTKK